MDTIMDTLPTNSSFDPFDQTLIITLPDGQTQFAARISTIFQLQSLAVLQAIVYAIQLGVSLLLMIILALMTKADKRRSLVFIFNISTLILIFVRSIVTILQLHGPIWNYYNWVAAYYPNNGHSTGLNIASEILSWLIIACMEFSMMFQVRIVCCTLRTRYRRLINLASGIMVLTAIALRLAAAAVNIKYGIIGLLELTPARNALILATASNGTIAVITSIVFFSSIFCAKLGHAIWQRRKMGMTQFGPMQIIFVMGCQTLVIPCIFGFVSYYSLIGSQLYSLMPVVVAIFLPLSSIWASTNTQGNVNIAAPARWQHRKPSTTVQSSNRDAYSSEKGLMPSTVNTDCTLVDPRGESVSSASPGKHASTDRDSIDLEMQKMGRIRVDRGYSVRTD